MGKSKKKNTELEEEIGEVNHELHLAVSGKESQHTSIVTNADLLTEVPSDCIPINLPLPCPVYVKLPKRFVMFRDQQDVISRQRLMTLEKMGASSLFIPNQFWDFFVKALEDIEIPEPITTEKKINHIRSLMIVYAEEMQKKKRQSVAGVFEKLKKLAFKMGDEVCNDPKTAILQIKKNTLPSVYFLHHGVNTSILSGLIGKSLGYSADDIRTLTLATLVHDVGNLFLPKRLLFKPGDFTREERSSMEAHTHKGAELLASIGAPGQCIAVAIQHHERFDGTGYPKGLKGKEIHPFAKVVAIADVFDAITSNRPYKAGETAKDALKKMRAEEGLFDPDFLSKLKFG